MDRSEFDKLAGFNKFQLAAEEAAALQGELERVLTLLEPLTTADFGDTPLMVRADSVLPVYRQDVAAREFSREAVLANAPEQAEHCFVVPRVAD